MLSGNTSCHNEFYFCMMKKAMSYLPVRACQALFCLPCEAGKPGPLKEEGVTPIEGKIIRLARA